MEINAIKESKKFRKMITKKIRFATPLYRQGILEDECGYLQPKEIMKNLYSCREELIQEVNFLNYRVSCLNKTDFFKEMPDCLRLKIYDQIYNEPTILICPITALFSIFNDLSDEKKEKELVMTAVYTNKNTSV